MFQTELREIVSLLKFSQYVVAFTGAGISTASGIPDFRSPESGLWNDPNALQAASLMGFRQNPRSFYEWVRPLATKLFQAVPNRAHEALAQLEASNHLQAIITQNIDRLHQKAGSNIVFELHGNIETATCTHCLQHFDVNVIRAVIEAQQVDVPLCPTCHNVIKPDVILFGEELPFAPFQKSKQAAQKADFMFILGTSLEVAPASDLPKISFRNGAKLVVINNQPTPLDALAFHVIRAKVDEVLPEIAQLLGAI